jgi:hypothetical protein
LETGASRRRDQPLDGRDRRAEPDDRVLDGGGDVAGGGHPERPGDSRAIGEVAEAFRIEAVCLGDVGFARR